MIGNGRRGAGERDRDLEEDDELESREERSSESGGGGGGGFGGWRSHLLGGLTQRVKSWYWGARPLVFLKERKHEYDIIDSIIQPRSKRTGCNQCNRVAIFMSERGNAENSFHPDLAGSVDNISAKNYNAKRNRNRVHRAIA
ncbi:hypothetical protein EAG_09006 [Camponotus floridanus]|uniref:Uncharacterized protein n=1 Tax=Camponotus floridanus TaxID=104421 RepID=E2AQT3_CAMFO|nr:hypothetical protein EAG_09006 [Camponotus floridanus]